SDPSVMTPERTQAAVRMRADGDSIAQIAAHVWRWCFQCLPRPRQARRDPRCVVTGVSVACESLWTNADDRLPLASVGRVEGRNGIVEGRDVADVRPQSSVPHPLDNLTKLGATGLDNKVDRQAVRGPRLGRSDDGHQCSSGSNQTRGPRLDVATDDIENQIDFADVFQSVVVEVDELLRAEVERLLTVGGTSGADYVCA